MNHHWKLGSHIIACVFAVAAYSSANAQDAFHQTEDIYTNAVGILRVTTVSEDHDFGSGMRPISLRDFELYPQPGLGETNRIMSLAGSDRTILDKLEQLIDQEVMLEGRLVERYTLNEKGESHRWLYHLVVTNVSPTGPGRAPSNLSRDEAHRLARTLLVSHFGLAIEDAEFARSVPPKLISGRWIWVWRRGSGNGDVEVTVTFAKDGSSREFQWEFLIQ